MNITQMVTGFATPVIASKISGALGVPEGMVRKVIAVAAPVLLGAIMKRSAAPDGPEALGSALSSVGSDPLDSLRGLLDSGDAADVAKAGSSGADLLTSLLGGGTAGTLASKLAGHAGIDAGKAGPLLGLAGTMALGGLKKTAVDQGMDAAGIVKMLQSQKNEIAAAIPADLAAELKGTDILGSDLLAAAGPAPAAAKPAAAKPAARPPAPTPKRGGMSRWIIGLIVLALLVWLLTRMFGGPAEEPVVEEVAPAPEATEPVAEPVEEVAEPVEEAAAPAEDPLVVDGVDIGSSLQGVFDSVGGALAGVTDAASAEAAVDTLNEADAELGTIQTAAANLPAEGTSALQAMIAGALPALQSTIESLLADSAIAPVVQPALDGIMAKLNALAG